MNKISVVIISKNDNYGGDLLQRSSICLSNMIKLFDEVVYVDYCSDISLIDEIKNKIQFNKNLLHIKITTSDIKNILNNKLHNIHIIETISRNVGIVRSSNDWILNTNIDIVCDSFDTFDLDKNLVYVSNRREVSQNIFSKLEQNCFNKILPLLKKKRDDFRMIQDANDGSGNPIHDKNDPWSTVVCCGDFQLAHKDLIWKMKGYEESMVGRSYADSNFMKKSFIYGGGSKKMNPPVDIFHLSHSNYTERKNGMIMPTNDVQTGLYNFQKTSNNENWGFQDYKFYQERI